MLTFSIIYDKNIPNKLIKPPKGNRVIKKNEAKIVLKIYENL